MPRQTIKINGFTISFNDDGYDQIDKVIDMIDADRLMYKNIMDSNYIEQDILPKNNINDAIDYMKSNVVPQIDELYEALFKRETFRHCSAYVSDKNNSKIISVANVGVQLENIYPKELQELVDFAYGYDQSNRIMVLFACYLLYEHIHPHEDGNGGMGRLLFLENIYQLSETKYLNSIQDRKTRQDRKVRDSKSCRTVGQMDRLRFHPQFDIKHIRMNIIAQNQYNRYRYMKTY
ncbi:MAG: hypothetical protein EZS28_006969 [Streblomastix strix]|uniref:Uncharacterized protein n=1 Tax=Streblomastix strix TaxID=222440 RepID=A0A5J4WRD7_9EUKA|nr:MAG: hypothetical protein EZS28_006969 [Streblomastix strix]